MNFYRIVDTAQESRPGYLARFECTLDEAHGYAKLTPKVSWSDIRIELGDIPTQKADVCAILNHEMLEKITSLRTWRLTQRGGLIECENGQ